MQEGSEIQCVWGRGVANYRNKMKYPNISKYMGNVQLDLVCSGLATMSETPGVLDLP